MVRPVPPNLVQPPTFLGMDPPQHTRYRQVMSAAFTPKPGREKLGFRRPA
jgi:cytochrome P450